MQETCCGHKKDFCGLKTIEELQKNMPSEEEIKGLSSIYKILSDPTRLRIIYVLSRGECCVCDIAEGLHMTQSAISHQLKRLRTYKLVKSRRDGKSMIYFLDDDHVFTLFQQGMEHVKHTE